MIKNTERQKREIDREIERERDRQIYVDRRKKKKKTGRERERKREIEVDLFTVQLLTIVRFQKSEEHIFFSNKKLLWQKKGMH